MTLMACRECGAKVSTEASACPSCGAKPPKPPKAEWRKKPAFVAFSLFVALLIYGHATREPDSRSATPVEPPAKNLPTPPSKPPEVKRNTEVGENTVYGGMRLLKMNMRDPSSFQLESAVLMDSKAICYTYRARNGYGGLNLEHAVLNHEGTAILTEQMNGFAATWNRDCRKKGGHDYAEEINAIAKYAQ